MTEALGSPALDARSRGLRRAIVQMLAASRRGHVGSAFSLVEILRVLYDDILRYDPQHPRWPGRDRCILSKGHGCLALYVVLADKGFFPFAELQRFCRSDALLGGHPEHKIPGVEVSTGSLGHGLSIGLGSALNAKCSGADYRVFVIAGDGECNEGSVWEAAMCAGKHELSGLTVVVDYNRQQSYGDAADVQDLEPFGDKWRSFGFAVAEVDGHDVDALRRQFTALPLAAARPSAIICHTTKGKGVPLTERNPDWHHKTNVSDAEVDALLTGLDG